MLATVPPAQPFAGVVVQRPRGLRHRAEAQVVRPILEHPIEQYLLDCETVSEWGFVPL